MIERNVVDYEVNSYGESMIDFLISSSCCILNGRNMIKNDYTRIASTGRSVVDYCLVPHEQLNRHSDFVVYKMSELNMTLVKRPDHSLLKWSTDLTDVTSGLVKDHANHSVFTEIHQIDVSSLPSDFLMRL